MARRKTTEVKFPESWRIETEFEVDKNTTLTQGDECQIKGERGVYRFVKFVVNESIDNHVGWVTVFGGAANYGAYRSVEPNKIKPIKKMRKTRS